ncbi:hypothetical protein EXU57_22200 [Segetibacter sp. 3557_3]|uniref:PID-CTERM protein-sorting domain-containing protein n=1 Tax=Segetibacter sp. 3557_3 TaxID=2547429 RepID=UPI001058A8A5|nr:hypothetical protein [Segetibacter sp. 3557_3]TDH19991.1 hypothetical protein EXU57_22200 [Segetibacter sp. 3557_3]
MKKFFVSIQWAFFIIVGLSIFPAPAHAQDPGEDPDVPLDGGLTLLIAAGVGYGVKKAVDYRNEQKETNLD